MPQTERSGFEEYNKEHIPNAIFFDLDANSKIDTDLPHMLTDINSWELLISSMGIENKDEIVVYDNSDVISSCRCWYNLIYFGHNPKLVHVLDGGLKKWKKENKITNNETVSSTPSNYKANENKKLVKNKQEIDKNISKNEFNVIDARSRERFEGKVAEPRKGLRSGSIKNSFCLPFSELINTDDRTFIAKDKIVEKFKSFISEQENEKPYDLLIVSHDGIDDVNETGPLIHRTAKKMGIKSYLAETMGSYMEDTKDGKIYYSFPVDDKGEAQLSTTKTPVDYQKGFVINPKKTLVMMNLKIL